MDRGGSGRDGAEEAGELVDREGWPDDAIEEHVPSENNVGDDGGVVHAGEVPEDGGGVGVGRDGLAAGWEPFVAATVGGDDVAL